jgi:hypothetical protein
MSIAPILERTKTALKTGEWWTIPWWQDEKYYKNGFACRDSAATAFNELKRTFDPEWMLGQKINSIPPFSHQIAVQLMTEGLLPFQFLYELGINLHTARGAGLIGDIERRLKSPKEYWEAAAFELKFLSSLIRSGYNVERNYRSGKGRHNCDFKVSKGSETVFFEIKRPWKVSAQNQEIINQARSHFYTKLLSDDIRKEEDFTSSPLSSKSEVDKVFRLIRYAVNNQIPEEGPGVVIVESPYALNWNEFALMAEKRFQGRKKYPALSAIILIQPLFQDGKICHNSRIVFNPQASIDIHSLPVMEVLNNMNEIGRDA